MTNILMIFEDFEPTNQESYMFFSEISSKDYFELRSKRCVDVTKQDIDWCDVVYSIRSTSAIEASLAKYAKKLGKYWILLLDDDFLSLGKDYGQDGQGYREEKKKCLIKVLKYTNCLVAPNKNLIDKYSSYGKIERVYKCETAIDVDHIVLPQRTTKNTKIVYYVNDGTTVMFEKYLRQVFYRLADKYSGKISLYFMAIHPNLHDLDDKLDIHYVPHMSFDKFLKYIAEQHFDIGLAPLDDDGFCRYKYINKFIEYTRSGVAGIYSDCELYRTVIVPGENGVLCDNTVDGWVDAIEKLINDADYKMKIALGAQEYVRNYLSREAMIKSILSAIPELTSYKAPDKRANLLIIIGFRFEYFAFRIRGWLFTAYSCIKSGNIKGLLRRVARKFGWKE